MNKVSAVIITHNRCDVLKRAIESVLKQSYNNIELIVVSDGSTDGTDDLMQSYVSLPNVHYISYHPGHGGNYARNQGILTSKGDYVAFLDDDDEWLPQKIELQVRKMEANPNVGLVYTAVKSIFINEKCSYNFYPNTVGDLRKTILFGNCIGTTSCVMVRKSILMDNLFDENLRALQDFELWIRLCQITKVAACQEVLLNYYNQSATKQITSNTTIYEDSINYIAHKHSDLYKSLDNDENKKLFVCRKLEYAQRCIRNGQKKKARNLAIEALKCKITKQALVFFVSSFFSMEFILKIRCLISK